jgi:hypothetical protein
MFITEATKLEGDYAIYVAILILLVTKFTPFSSADVIANFFPLLKSFKSLTGANPATSEFTTTFSASCCCT